MTIIETKPTLEISKSEVETLKSFYEILNEPIFEDYGSYELLEDIVKKKESFYVNIVYKEN